MLGTSFLRSTGRYDFAVGHDDDYIPGTPEVHSSRSEDGFGQTPPDDARHDIEPRVKFDQVSGELAVNFYTGPLDAAGFNRLLLKVLAKYAVTKVTLYLCPAVSEIESGYLERNGYRNVLQTNPRSLQQVWVTTKIEPLPIVPQKSKTEIQRLVELQRDQLSGHPRVEC